MHLASERNHPKVVELLMHKGTESIRTMKNKSDHTPLELAKSLEVKMALSRADEMHRWPSRRDLMMYINGLAKEKDEEKKYVRWNIMDASLSLPIGSEREASMIFHRMFTERQPCHSLVVETPAFKRNWRPWKRTRI